MKNKKPNNADKCAECSVRAGSVFCDLPKDSLAIIDQIRKNESYNKGEDLPTRKSGINGFYCILSGHVKEGVRQDGGEKIVRICGPQDLVGFGSSDYVIGALEKTSACFVPLDEFHKIRESVPQLSSNLIQMLCKIVQIKDNRISSLENNCVRNRVASLLMSLMKKFGVPSGNGTHIDAYVDRHTMAKLAGTSPETFARAVTELQFDGIVSREKRAIHILDREKLQRIAEE